MSRLCAVRHGQASFFAEDYDKLSAMGERQARILAEYWIHRGDTFDEAYAGTLNRQQRTAQVVAETYREMGLDFPEFTVDPAFNEYDADNIMDCLLPELCERDERIRMLKADFDAAGQSRERYKTFHRLLEAVMAEYIARDNHAEGYESWAAFSARVRGGLERILKAEGSGRCVAVFTSGGVIGLFVQTCLRAPDIAAAELNWRIHNCSLTEFTFTPNRFTLDTFNHVPHLNDVELLTYR